MITFKEFLKEAIKIGGGNARSAALQAFLDEFDKDTSPNPFMSRMGIWKESIGIELSAWQGHIHISSIMSFAKKNNGDASKALKWICDLADKHGVKMDLTVAPIKNAGAEKGESLNKSQLKAWYRRNGFVPVGGDNMLREPKKPE